MPYIPVTQAAKLLSKHPVTIRRWAVGGILAARKVGGQWLVDLDSVHRLLGVAASEKGDSRSHATHATVDKDPWARETRLKLWTFLLHHFDDFDPTDIVLMDRKGRIVEPLDLIPDQYEDRIVYPSALDWVGGALGLKDRRVLILDEIIQRGRGLADLRGRLEARGAIVRTIALVRRRSSFEAGRSEDPQVFTCLDLEDEEFARTTARLAGLLDAHVVCLDVDHFPTCSLRFVSPPSVEELASDLASLGPIHFVPATAPERTVVSITVDLPRFFDWSRLALPKELAPEGVCKLRTYYDPDEGLLTVVPVVYPAATFSKRSIERIAQSVDEKWSRYLLLPDDWSTLTKDVQAQLLFRLLVIYCGTELMLQSLPYFKEIAAKHGIDGAAQGFEVAGSDLRRVFGQTESVGLFDVVSDALAMAWKRVKSESPYQVTLSELSAEHEASNVTPGDFEEFAKVVSTQAVIEAEAKRGLTKSELMDKLGWAANRLSRLLDFCLDHGLVKPMNEVRLEGGKILCLRSYRGTEFLPRAVAWDQPPDENTSQAFTLEGHAARRIAWVIPYVLDRLMAKGGGLEEGVHEFLREKVFANLLLDWDPVRFSPLYMTWTPYFFGPITQIPRLDKPNGGLQSPVAFTLERAVCEMKPVPGRRDRFNRPVRALVPKGDAWKRGIEKDLDGVERDYLDGLVDIYHEMYRRFDQAGSSGQASVDLLLTFAACRNFKQAYICAYEDIALWRREIELALELMEVNVDTAATDLCERPLERATWGYKQAGDKLDRYESLPKARAQVEQRLADHPRSALVAHILQRTDSEPQINEDPPYPLARVKRLIPLIEATTTLVHYASMKMGLAADRRRPANKSRGAEHYSKKVLAAHSELSEVGEQIELVAARIDDGGRDSSLVAALHSIVRRVFRIIDRDLPEPDRSPTLGSPSASLDGFLADVIEAASRVASSPESGILLLDLHGFIPIAYDTAEALGVPIESVETVARDAALKVTRQELNRMGIKPGVFEMAGGDGWFTTHDNVDELVELACRIQLEARRSVPGSRPKIALTFGRPGKVGPGAALGTGFVRAWYLAEKTKMVGGAIRMSDELRDKMGSKRLCDLLIPLGEVELGKFGSTAIYEVEWGRFGEASDK